MCKKLLDIKYFSSFPLTHYIEGHAGVFGNYSSTQSFISNFCCKDAAVCCMLGWGKWANLGNDNKVTAAVAELMWLWQGSDLLIGDVNVCWLLCPSFMHPNYHHHHHTRTLRRNCFMLDSVWLIASWGFLYSAPKYVWTLIKVILWLKRSSLEVIIYPASWALFENK